MFLLLIVSFAPFLFDIPVTEEFKEYLHEGKCQFLMFAAIGILKFQKTVIFFFSPINGRRNRIISETSFITRSEINLCHDDFTSIRTESFVSQVENQQEIRFVSSVNARSIFSTNFSRRFVETFSFLKFQRIDFENNSGQWLETLTKDDFDEIQLKHENYVSR